MAIFLIQPGIGLIGVAHSDPNPAPHADSAKPKPKKPTSENKAEQPTEKSKPVAPDKRTLLPAYNTQMLRLAEILGAIHYLRDLCEAKEGQLWREQMENIIANEEPTPERKAALVGQFNRGFRTYREIYSACTPSAVEAVNLYMRAGTRLAGEIPGRFGR